MLVLASQSPRRTELLRAAGIEHLVRVAGIDESPLPNESPLPYARRMAIEKARAVPLHPGETVLAADTIVVSPGGQILGKPTGADDARRMLRLLSGAWHEVITAFCVRKASSERVDHDTTRVHFLELTNADIDAYIATGEPLDKAGAYGIQGRASLWIDRIEGSYTNVVGLPVWKLDLSSGH